ncbi:NADPH--cytochrome P450 reductase-like [Physella acuta]|uniref:NADPH--cytochrome P450 reductase-like n=1 Tax=Physella acuta TaxID=109671 RepID=UPI0027DC4628|nr:NADPH--cytochrome P450 reductase-like [Physella acuta]XP_059147611.1 NADPH--cytochrome P450 reductase-like [Physella acuta]XP_059147620.1 NADPH--cytochrome P450 reductase-like [Physella acuta]
MSTTEQVEMAVSESLISMTDLFILSLAGGFAFYWFFVRNKKQEAPNFKKLSIAPVLERSESSDASFITKMKNTNRNVVVFYGSQTGTAEEFATRLAKDASRYGMKGMVADPEECEMEDLSKLAEIENSLAIFCMATYGEGDPTDNAQEFHEYLANGGESLAGIRFAVFGLGNKTYEHYNSMGKFVDKRLEELGAERVFELGLGDDDANIEEDFVTWKEKFWPAVCSYFGVEATGENVNTRQYALTPVPEDLPKEKIFTGEPARVGSFTNQKPPYDVKNPYLAPITVNRQLHKGGDRSCMHIELDISESKIRYETGDHVAIYPVNDSELVEKLGKRLGVDLDTVFSLTNIDEDASKKHPFPCPCSYRTALMHYIDITNPPRTHVLGELAEYTDDQKDKEFLQKMTHATEEGKKLYQDWIHNDHRNILAVLEDIPSLRPPIDHICELLPRLQPRFYSISSSPKVHPKSIHITAVLIEYTTPTSRVSKGVCTSWLASKKPSGDAVLRVPIYVRKSQFRLPFKPATPVVMIGPGTGLAPFRGFIQERDYFHEEGKPVGDTILYFGCRNKATDFIYEEELMKYVDKKVLKLHTAFSRDQPQKIYVQHLIDQNHDEIWNVLNNNGHIYICGDAKNMARDVHAMLVKILTTKGDMSTADAEDYIKKLQSKGRYSADVWS